MKAWCCVWVLLLTGCVSVPDVAERRAQADQLAQAGGWQAVTLDAGSFDLRAYVPQAVQPTERLTVYVEGDGLAWLNTQTVSPDPTPLNPLALRLALQHPSGAAAYLARPCMYVGGGARNCTSRYWTGARFAPEVVDASSLALDALKARFGARDLVLVGYSGGGAVAALLAARRNDVDMLVTVAGNLDTAAWARQHRLTPLGASLNPLDDAERLQGVRQVHFVGARDTNITPALVAGFLKAQPQAQAARMQSVEGFDHRCCWAEQWPQLAREAGLD